jgi:hypothetical protein
MILEQPLNYGSCSERLLSLGGIITRVYIKSVSQPLAEDIFNTK